MVLERDKRGHGRVMAEASSGFSRLTRLGWAGGWSMQTLDLVLPQVQWTGVSLVCSGYVGTESRCRAQLWICSFSPGWTVLRHRLAKVLSKGICLVTSSVSWIL